MRRTIRIKVKTLILFGLVLLVAAGGGFGLLSRPENSNAITAQSENERLGRLLRENNYAFLSFVNIGDGIAMGHSRIDWGDGIEIFNAYEQFKRTEVLEPSYVVNVALAQWFSGHTDATEQVIRNADTANWDVMDVDRLTLLEVGVALNAPKQDVEAILALLEGVKSHQYARVVNTIKAYLSVVLGADVAYVAGDYVDLQEQGEETFVLYFQNLTSLVRSLEAVEAEVAGQTIRVKVTNRGEPYAGAVVYQRTHSGMSTSFIPGDPVGVTDQEGLVELPVKGSLEYGVGVLMPWHLVHDALWPVNSGTMANPAPGIDYAFAFESGVRFTEIVLKNGAYEYTFADPSHVKNRSYRLHVGFTKDVTKELLGATYGYVALQGAYGRVAVDDLKMAMHLPFSRYHMNDWAMSLDYFIEPLYLSGTYRFGIQLDDAKGSYWNGCFSDALYTFVEVDGASEISEGDRLLEAGKLNEAKAFYWSDGSLHSLKVLEALYAHETQWEKVIEVTLKIVDAYGNSEWAKNNLSWAYGEIGDYVSQERLIREMIEESPDNMYLINSLGICLVNQGAYLEGLSYLEAMQEERDYKYWDASVFLVGNVLSGVSDEMKAIAERIHLKLDARVFNWVVKGEYLKAYDFVLAMPPSDARSYLKLLLEDAFDFLKPDKNAFYESYISEVERIEDEDMAMLLKLIKKAGNWF